jgi:hypothetical protein
MDQRDQELLDKQMRRLTPPPRSEGTIVLAIMAVFIAGMTLGGYLVADREDITRDITRLASSATSASISALPIAR